MSTDPGTQPARKRGRGADPEQTKRQLIAAAIESLVADGYRGTTARSIAARAGCNQAAIYYHFGGIDALLIQALKVSSAQRLERYQTSLTDGQDLTAMLDQIAVLFAEDRTTGHLGLLAELVGGITASPELRAGIDDATAPWLDFVEERVKAASENVSFAKLLPARDLADLIFSLVLGIEMRNKVDNNHERSDRLFRLARLAAGLAQVQPRDQGLISVSQTDRSDTSHRRRPADPDQ